MLLRAVWRLPSNALKPPWWLRPDMDQRTTIGLGLVLLAVSSAILFAAGNFQAAFRWALAGAAALGLAFGSLLVGTSRQGRAV